MAISFVQSKSVATPVTPDLTFNADNVAGNLLIIVARISSITPTTFTYSDTLNNVVDAQPSQFNATASTVTQVFVVRNCKAGPNTVTVLGGTMQYIAVHEFSGVNSIDQTSIAMGTGLSQDSGPITTTHADELLFGYEDAGVQSTITGDPTWTTAESFSSAFLTQYKIVSATGTFNSTTTATAGKSGVVNWTEEIISFFDTPSTTSVQIITF